jgi:hypothetical protein
MHQAVIVECQAVGSAEDGELVWIAGHAAWRRILRAWPIADSRGS